jgi:hypothetical protein
MADYHIVSVDSSNVEEFGFFCVKNTKHPGYIAKLSWLQKRFDEGMRIKLIVTSDGRPAGFLEYIPGEHTWRVVNAPDYFAIHCLWVASKKFPYEGMTSALLKDCLKDARSSDKAGVAVVTSDGTWMAGKKVFVKHGFEQVDETEPHFQLLVRQLKKGLLPTFPKNWDERLRRYRGLQLVYTNQCPYIGKAVEDLPPVAKKYGVRLNLVELKNANEAREKMPSPYGTVSLVYDGRLLADHPISATRFKNILERGLKLTVKKQ